VAGRKLGNHCAALQHDTVRQDHEGVWRLTLKACQEVLNLLHVAGRYPLHIHPKLTPHGLGYSNLSVEPWVDGVAHQDNVLG
jgi:hypothetical protein